MKSHHANLTPADEAHLAYLKRQVDRLSDIRFHKDAPVGVENQLFRARQELSEFVESLRRKGYPI